MMGCVSGWWCGILRMLVVKGMRVMCFWLRWVVNCFGNWGGGGVIKTLMGDASSV